MLAPRNEADASPSGIHQNACLLQHFRAGIGRRSCELVLVDFEGRIRQRAQENFTYPTPELIPPPEFIPAPEVTAPPELIPAPALCLVQCRCSV